MILKIKINDTDEFETYSIDDVSIYPENNPICFQPIIAITFSSYRKIVKTFQLWKECYIIDNLNDVTYAIVPFSAAHSRNTIEQTNTDFYTAIDDASYVYNYKIKAASYQITKKEDEKKKEMKYYFYVRFANSRGLFNNSTKIYTYEVSQGHYEYYHIGDIINIRELKYEDKTYEPNYSSTSIRIEGKQSFVEDSIPEQIKAVAIRYITKIEFIKWSTEPPDWFENFIKKHKFTLELKYDPVIEQLICHYRDPKTGWLYTYNEIIEHHYSYNFLIYEQKPSEFKLTDEQIKTMLVNSLVPPHSQLSINKDTLYVDTTKSTNMWCTQAPSINNIYENTMKNNEKKAEEKEMKMFDNITKNMKFGKYETGDAKYSINGIAFRDEKGGYFTYIDNVATDVTGMTIDIPLFCMPVALSQVATNDIILFKDKIVIVKEKTDDGIKIIYPLTSEIKVIIPEKNLFGLSFCSKIINPFEFVKNTANENNPFGNLLPLILFDDMKNDNDKDNDMIKLIMFSQLGGSTNFNNILPFLFLNSNEGNKNMDSLLTLMMLSNFTNIDGATSTNSFINSFFPNMGDSTSKTQ